MQSTVTRTAFLPSTSSGVTGRSSAAALLFFALLWFQVINHLRSEWSVNPQYAYGWTVPFVAIYLIWKRWPERPAPNSPASGFVPILLTAFCALFFFPIRFVAEANPDWRLLSWAIALIAITISLCVVFLAGGRPWLRYFAFPFLFFLLAVPWPTHFEQAVIQGLMRVVTAINVVVLNAVGIPALQHGNVIEVRSGLIGIEEACSGVRSLQATLMISIFLGELYSFTITRRVLLVVAGGVLAFLCNLVRTALLVWIGAKHGAGAIESWHDPAGLSILLICLFGLWLLSLLMRRHSKDVVTSPDIQNSAPFRLSWPLLVSLTLWVLFIEAGTQVWYRSHQSPLAGSRWAVGWPTSDNAYKSVPIAREAQDLLRYDEGGGATWDAPDGRRWIMYFFRWFPGRTAALFVKVHRPDICLPASGLTMNRDNGIRLLTVNGVNLPIRSYRFDDHGGSLHVFYCYWDARSSYENSKTAVEEDWSALGRLRAALQGRREIGAQMLEVAVWGYQHDAEADEALQRQLAQIIRRS
ncbi:MAG: exosortase/archaeosortase family protein [Verrucomicrobiota bacterium]|nr:exosortase/archaeosortase family protein [Verrucomicrobiota bacterium]